MSQRQIENEPGFWLIELNETSVLSTNPAFHSFASALFTWLAAEVSDRLDLPSKSIRLEAIEANYQGAYPCLAAKLPSGEISGADADEIERAIRDILLTTTLQDILEELSSQQLPAGP